MKLYQNEVELSQRHFDVFDFLLRQLKAEKMRSKNSDIFTTFLPHSLI